MSCLINASSTNGLTLTSDLSGQLQFANNGVNLPMGGVAPAFSAYQSTLQSVSNGTATKVQFQNKDFDTNSNYDNATNYRFTPTVAGYYQINASVQITSTTASIVAFIYKNGTQYAVGGVGSFASGAINTVSQVACLMFFNGSTDYAEIYVLQASGISQNTGASNATRFNGSLVRGA